jgi:hypothetical protein
LGEELRGFAKSTDTAQDVSAASLQSLTLIPKVPVVLPFQAPRLGGQDPQRFLPLSRLFETLGCLEKLAAALQELSGAMVLLELDAGFRRLIESPGFLQLGHGLSMVTVLGQQLARFQVMPASLVVLDCIIPSTQLLGEAGGLVEMSGSGIHLDSQIQPPPAIVDIPGADMIPQESSNEC